MDEIAVLPTSLASPGRCQVMGVVNVTPDSFSDGGKWLDPARAVQHGLALLAEGADLIDVGGESTRPGAERVPVAEELRRVLPVIRGLADAGATVSIDTMRAEVAEAALAAGAVLVNDVSGGLADPRMPALIAAAGVPFVVMHWRGPSAVMDSLAVYADVVGEVAAELAARVEQLVAAGVAESQLILDPGIGFAKQVEHNWQVLAELDRITHLGRPVLIGTSRKRFLGSLLAGADRLPVPVAERDDATAATTVIAAMAGVWAVRVHACKASADAVRVVSALRDAQSRGAQRAVLADGRVAR